MPNFIACIAQIWPIYTDGVAWSVFQLITTIGPAKTDEPIENTVRGAWAHSTSCYEKGCKEKLDRVCHSFHNVKNIFYPLSYLCYATVCNCLHYAKCAYRANFSVKTQNLTRGCGYSGHSLDRSSTRNSAPGSNQGTYVPYSLCPTFKWWLATPFVFDERIKSAKSWNKALKTADFTPVRNTGLHFRSVVLVSKARSNKMSKTQHLLMYYCQFRNMTTHNSKNTAD